MFSYVIARSPGELFSETHDNSVAILLSYDTAHILLAGDPYIEPLTVVKVQTYKIIRA